MTGIGDEPWQQVTVLYRSERTRIYRTFGASGERIVHKEASGADAAERVRHERDMLARLEGVAGVPQLAPDQDGAHVIALRDHGGVTLAQILQHEPLPLGAVLDLALALSRIVAAVHARGVVHHDIAPPNVLLTNAQRSPMLIDFQLATAGAEAGRAARTGEIVGTLAYASPEQVSFSRRPVDHRADLYALGAILYELLVGHPPFRQQDVAQLVSDQLTQVPAAPSSLAPATPALLSALVLRLLDKEPDQRYQSADGLAHDLTRIQQLLAAGAQPDFVLGLRDFPPRLGAPAELVGREAELRQLLAAFEHSLHGSAQGVLLSGPAGVGKKRLMGQLQPVVAARTGYFVSGRFDQQRQDRQSDGVYMAFRALGRQLLAEPDADLVALRARLQAALGVNAALMAASSPEFGIIMGMAPESWSTAALDAPPRLLAAVGALLRAIVTPQRPLVMAIDDVQWAPPFSLAILDALMCSADLPGLLLVVAWRDHDLQPGHPLTTRLPEWRARGAIGLELGNLSQQELATLLGRLLRLPAAPAHRLATALAQHSGGNPYDTIELINSLRQSDVLRNTDSGWTWDADALRRHVGISGAASLLLARVHRLPAASVGLLQTMACLGGELRIDQLAVASGIARDAVDQLLVPALDDGLLAPDAEGGVATVRFRHNRVQQTVYAALQAATRARLHLDIARRLNDGAAHAPLAAAQYLAALDLIEPAERDLVIVLFRQAASLNRQSNDTECERLLQAALQLLQPPRDDAGRRLRDELRCDRHAALVRLGRADEADALYAVIDASVSAPLDLVQAACLQISALMLRRELSAAVALSMQMLERLGFRSAMDDDSTEACAELDTFAAWLAHQAELSPLAYPEVDDARIAAIAKVFERCVRAAFFIDDRLLARLALGAWRLWREHGVCAPMVAPASFIGIVAIRQRGDYQLGYEAARFLLRLSEARGYALEAVRVRAVLAVSHAHWREPLEQCTQLARLSYAALIQGGDLLAACLPLIAVVSGTLECAPNLGASVAEAEAALGIAARAHNLVAVPYFHAVIALECSLQGDGDAMAQDATAGFTPVGRCNWHILQALHSALMGEPALLDAQSQAAYAMRDILYGGYSKALATLLRALALTQQAQQCSAAQRAPLLSALQPLSDTLAQWAADAPENFRHLQVWIEAERAWAAEDFSAAARGYDEALIALDLRQRPWHRALITERAGRFHLAHAMPRQGQRLLAEAHGHYLAWGATAKVGSLEREYGFLLHAPGPQPVETERRSSVSADSLQMLAVLRASQALSSETSLGRLHARVAEQLGAMTGASKVQMMLPGEGPDAWIGAGAPDGEAPAAASAQQLPLSAFRYVARTRAALVVDDATRDERFSADAYWQGMAQCSLLLLPILSRGVLRAILLLENQQRRSAFAADRLEAVQLIAGQLAVSLDNALLYASLERKVAERTQALELANQELAALSVTDALTGLANRRQFDQTLEVEWRRAQRTGEWLGAAMIDIDQFKLYNDHYGHQQGDACLQLVAAALAQSVRQGVDLVARYGGEEFAIILPGADRAETSVVAERARAAVAALLEPHLTATHGIVTISVGVASLRPDPALSATSLFGAADAALYAAKQGGRNRVGGAV